VFLGGAGMLLAAAALLARIRVEGRIDLTVAGGKGEAAGRMIAAGFRAIARASRLRLLIGLAVAQSFVRGGAVAIGSIAASAVDKAAGPRPAYVVVGLILPLLTLATYCRLVEIDKSIAPAPELELIERVPMF